MVTRVMTNYNGQTVERRKRRNAVWKLLESKTLTIFSCWAEFCKPTKCTYLTAQLTHSTRLMKICYADCIQFYQIDFV